MLTRLRLLDFKSFVDETILIAPFTVFVGPNASGKSNVLDSLRLLQGLGLGFTLTDALRGRIEGGRQVWPGIRGGLREVSRTGSGGFAIETTWRIDGVPVTHAIRCVAGEGARIAGEGIFENVYADWDRFLVTTGDMASPPMDSHNGRLAGTVHGVDASRTPFQVDADRSFLFQFGALPQRQETLKQITFAASLHKLLELLTFLELSPSSMRGYAPRGATELSSQGDNLSAVLYQICQAPDRKADLIDWVSELCQPRVIDIDFIEVRETGDVMLVLVEEGGSRVTARSASDGTLRFLAVLAAILQSPSGLTLLVEEPEVGLHPTRVSLLAEILESVAAQTGVQVIATTHSPVLVERLSAESLANVVAAGRDSEHGGTILRRLGDLPDFAILQASRDVGHLFATGWVERAL